MSKSIILLTNILALASTLLKSLPQLLQMSIYLILDLKLKIHMKNMHEILTGLTLERTAANACMPQNISNQKVRDDLSTLPALC